MTRRSMLLWGLAVFAAAFVAGSVARVDRTAAARAVEERLADWRGPRFPEGDTLAVADTLFARCGGLSAKPKTACYDKQLLALRAQRGTRFAMGTLNRLSVLDHDVAFTGHEYAHAIGIAAYKATPNDVAGAFKSCTEILQSGCYHGVIQTYLIAVPRVDTASVQAVCKEWTSQTTDRWLRFQCVHGMGHGLEMYLAHDLPKSLAGCDMLAEEWDRKSCYGGAFMENVVFATDPSMAEMVMGDQPAMHDMTMPSKTQYKMIDRKDPYYPCNAVGDRYQEDCWLMQPAVMLQIYDGDFDKTFKACDGAPEQWRASCYQGTGTEVSGATTMDHQGAIRFCSRGSTRWRPWCYTGVVKNFIDVTAKPGDGISFCREIPERPSQLQCYLSVGEEIAVLRNTLELRRPMCDPISGDAEAKDACLFGAQVITVAPRGLPVAD